MLLVLVVLSCQALQYSFWQCPTFNKSLVDSLRFRGEGECFWGGGGGGKHLSGGKWSKHLAGGRGGGEKTPACQLICNEHAHHLCGMLLAIFLRSFVLDNCVLRTCVDKCS